MKADISHFDKQIARNIAVDVPAHQIVDTVKITKLEQEQATSMQMGTPGGFDDQSN